MKTRLFIAMNIPEINLKEILQVRDEVYGKNDNIKWEEIDKLHITLQFLGDMENHKISNIKNELKNIAEKINQFETHFTRFGIFYRGNKPAILWVGIRNSDELIKLQKSIEAAMTSLGFEPETRKFKPHLTLLRIKGNEDLEKLNNFKKHKIWLDKFNITSFSLFKSELKQGGSVYTSLEKFKLN